MPTDCERQGIRQNRRQEQPAGQKKAGPDSKRKNGKLKVSAGQKAEKPGRTKKAKSRRQAYGDQG